MVLEGDVLRVLGCLGELFLSCSRHSGGSVTAGFQRQCHCATVTVHITEKWLRVRHGGAWSGESVISRATVVAVRQHRVLQCGHSPLIKTERPAFVTLAGPSAKASRRILTHWPKNLVLLLF